MDAHVPQRARVRGLRGGTRSNIGKTIPLSRFARVRYAPPFLWKGEDKRHDCKNTHPPSKRRGSPRSGGGMRAQQGGCHARDTTPSRTCTRTATSD